MILYAVLLRPIGFLAATSLFIAGSSVILGERKFYVLVPIALVTAGAIWYLVQVTLDDWIVTGTQARSDELDVWREALSLARSHSGGLGGSV